MDDPVVEQPPKKHRGWPKGKPRKPRVVQELPKVEVDDAPILVRFVLKSGQEDNFTCWDYNVDGSPWRFVSFPERRGRKLLRLLNPSEVADIEIEYPEYHKSQLEVAIPVPTSVTAGTVTTVLAPTPAVVVNPILERVRQGRGTSAVPLSKPGEQPRSAVTEFDAQGNASHRVVGATMLGGAPE